MRHHRRVCLAIWLSGDMVDLIAMLEARGYAVEALDRREAQRRFAAWCEVYCAEVKARTGSFRHRGYHWHAFRHGFVEALAGAKAMRQYLGMAPRAVVAIPESWTDGFGWRIDGRSLPDLRFLHPDIYVFPESLDWTMVFPHEPEYGPWFSWRSS